MAIPGNEPTTPPVCDWREVAWNSSPSDPQNYNLHILISDKHIWVYFRMEKRFCLSIVWGPGTMQSVSLRWICYDKFRPTWCHTEDEAGDLTCHVTQSHCAYIRPAGPSTDPLTPGVYMAAIRVGLPVFKSPVWLHHRKHAGSDHRIFSFQGKRTLYS